MKTQRRTVLHTLFPHQDDAAYQKLASIEELVADFKARRGTAPFRQRLQRAIARLSESLVEYCDSGSDAERNDLLLHGLRDCRKAASAVEMLYRARVCDRNAASTLLDLLADIAQILIDRLSELDGRPSPGALTRPLLMDEASTGNKSEETATVEKEAGESPPDRVLDG